MENVEFIYGFKKRIFKKEKKIRIYNDILFLLIKSLIIYFFCFIEKYIEIKRNSKKRKKIYFINKIKNYSNFEYFCCFCTMGKMENLYIRELLSYYMSIGVDKFVIADNNLPNTEKFSDVIEDFIKNNTVDIIDIIGKIYGDGELYAIIYEKYKNKCKWLTFFDFDEYLRMHSEDGKIIGIKEYLSKNIFKKCEAIIVNWLMYDDNNLIYYDNRTTLERFPNPLYNYSNNGFVKSIVRGNLNKTVFIANKSHHCPYKEVITCDSMGKIHYDLKYGLKEPLFKYAYLMHFNTRTAEEYVRKVKRGYPGNIYHEYNLRVELFFGINKYTEEKLKFFEKSFNKSFDYIRKNYNNK